MTKLGEILSDIPTSMRLKPSCVGHEIGSFNLFHPIYLGFFCQKVVLQKGYLVKGATFLLSDFQLKIPILMRPGHWSRRGNTD